VIAPFVERNVQAFGDLARKLGGEYVTACGRAGAAPDISLIERVKQALSSSPDIDEAAVEALMARIAPILEATEKTGALDENMLAELPTGLADQMRAAWAAARVASDREASGA
jgi:hypothetical protein